MEENKILQKINEAVQPPAGACFEDVLKRINAQSDEEREQSGKEALVLSEGKASGTSGVRRILAFAASVVAVLGLGIALIASGLGSVGFDMAASESMAEESVIEDAIADETTDLNTGEITDTETTVQTEEADGSASGDSDGENGQNTSTDIGQIFTASSSDIQMMPHYVEALELTIDLPADAYVTGRNVSPDFELLEVYGMSAAQLEANYKSRGIYYNAMWYDDSADVTEIVIKMTADDISEEIFNLSKANEEQLARIDELYHNYEVNIDAVVGAYYFDVSTVEHEQALFFRAEGVVNNRSGRSNHLQYMTIINGYRIEITLIEHFGIEGERTGEEPDEVSQSHKMIMEQVIRSVRWNRVRSNFLRENRSVIFYGAITLVGLAAVVVVLLLPENRKKPAEQEVTDDSEKTDSDAVTVENLSETDYTAGDEAGDGEEPKSAEGEEVSLPDDE